MKRIIRLTIVLISVLGASACARRPQSAACTDGLGCVVVGPGEPIRVGTLLTMTTPDSPYGIDALRGVEMSVESRGSVLGHRIELIKEDDLCSEDGGRAGASKLAADPSIVGVIGTTCSSATVVASRILSKAGNVLISPSSTAPSLTDPATHDAGFLRTIYNDKAQGQVVAEFAFSILGTQTMVTIHDGTAYAQELQQAACETLTQLGGTCILQLQIQSGADVLATLQQAALQKPDVLFFPVYAVDGAAIANQAALAGLAGTILMSSDGLLGEDFVAQTRPASEGMYLSGPSGKQESQAFLERFRSLYRGDPVASYHLQGYDAATMLLNGIEKVAHNDGSSLVIGRSALRQALFETRGLEGLSGPLNCADTGDCAEPNITIFQIADGEFRAVFP